ncbi:MAG: hypothetical protein IVW36_01550 [Dehalococcoidia bacterium]|nr:hypothetical protein [Dehalococcoidia bacterium]
MTIYSHIETERPPTGAEMERMGAFIDEVAACGKLVLTDGLLPSATGARVRLAAGKITVVDGPFSEAKEAVGGFAIFGVASKIEAIEISKRFLTVVGDGVVEVREMYAESAYERSAQARG